MKCKRYTNNVKLLQMKLFHYSSQLGIIFKNQNYLHKLMITEYTLQIDVASVNLSS